MWKGAVVLISLLAVSAAYVAIDKLAPKPEKFKDQEGCYIPKLDRVLPFGHVGSRPPRGNELCEQFRCDEDFIGITGCLSMSASPPCTIVVSRDKPYPDCCPQILCD